jgi:hypothetical protein
MKGQVNLNVSLTPDKWLGFGTPIGPVEIWIPLEPLSRD